jgi:hypothetical protein
LLRERDSLRRELDTDRAAARQPSELEKRLDADALNWLDKTDPSKGPVDYTNLPGVISAGRFEDALANREDERTATGALQFGSKGANPTAFALVKKQSADRRAERAAIGYADAVRVRDASVRGTAMGLASMDSARKQSLMGTSASLYGGAQQNVANYQPPPSPWWGVAQGALGAAGSFL